MKIVKYSFGELVVDGEKYTRDLIIVPGRIIPNWWRKEGHFLTLADLNEVPFEEIESLIIGTGKFGMMRIDKKLTDLLADRGIEVFIEKTAQAVHLFNQLMSSKKVAAGFHLTC
ncbi:MAG: Mth938-like domain-containing protein [Fidelibacterota bacterium]